MNAKPHIELPRETVEAFCRKWSIVEFSLFGSVMTDDFGPDSDVDVIVRFDPDAVITLSTLIRIKEELEGLYGRKVDILTRRAVEASHNPYRKKAILEGAQVVYPA